MGAPYVDITGWRFGRLVAVSPAEVDSRGRRRWLCKCDCGNKTIRSGTYLRSAPSKLQTCGCRHKDELLDVRNRRCTACKGVPAPGFTRCDRCRANMKETLSRLRDRAREVGVCSVCRCRVPDKGLLNCKECIARTRRNKKNAAWCDDCCSYGHRKECRARSAA